jgi:hypothetical protein
VNKIESTLVEISMHNLVGNLYFVSIQLFQSMQVFLLNHKIVMQDMVKKHSSNKNVNINNLKGKF